MQATKVPQRKAQYTSELKQEAVSLVKVSKKLTIGIFCVGFSNFMPAQTLT